MKSRNKNAQNEEENVLFDIPQSALRSRRPPAQVLIPEEVRNEIQQEIQHRIREESPEKLPEEKNEELPNEAPEEPPERPIKDDSDDLTEITWQRLINPLEKVTEWILTCLLFIRSFTLIFSGNILGGLIDLAKGFKTLFSAIKNTAKKMKEKINHNTYRGPRT